MNQAVILFGLADYLVHEIIEFYASREEAEEDLERVLRDEPDWRHILDVVEVELVPGGVCLNYLGGLKLFGTLGWSRSKRRSSGAAQKA